jgi:hypothetical protein
MPRALFPLRESAAFACIVVVMAIPNTSLWQGACAPVLSPATSLVRCLRGAAKCSNQALQSIQCSLPDQRLGSKWRTAATEEPRTRCESSYPDARGLIRFLPRLVHQRALEIIFILNKNGNPSNRQQPSSVVLLPSGGPSFLHNDTGGCSSVSSNR